MSNRYIRIAAGPVFIALAGWLFDASAAAAASSALPSYAAITSCVSSQLGDAGGTASCSQTDENGGDDLTLTLLPFAGLSADATVAGDVRDGFSTFGVLNYSFEVIGGAPGDLVPLLIYTNLVTSFTGPGAAYAFSEILVSTALANNLGEVACTASSNGCLGSFPSDFSGNFGVEATSGSVDTVHLEIEATASPVPNQGGASAFASADPLIYVDPGFAGAGDYSIVLSDGVANAESSSPEPGTLILICCWPFLFCTRRYLIFGHLRPA